MVTSPSFIQELISALTPFLLWYKESEIFKKISVVQVAKFDLAEFVM